MTTFACIIYYNKQNFYIEEENASMFKYFMTISINRGADFTVRISVRGRTCIKFTGDTM